MRVKDPNPDPKIEREHVCRSCGSKLAYIKPDVVKQTLKDYTGSSDDYFFIDCPQCLSRQQVPAWY